MVKDKCIVTEGIRNTKVISMCPRMASQLCKSYGKVLECVGEVWDLE